MVKEKVSLYMMKHYNMKEHEWIWRPSSKDWKGVVSITLALGRLPHTYWLGPRACLVTLKRKILFLFLPAIEPWFFGDATCSLVTTMTEQQKQILGAYCSTYRNIFFPQLHKEQIHKLLFLVFRLITLNKKKVKVRLWIWMSYQFYVM
jgi:hypothetical protein